MAMTTVAFTGQLDAARSMHDLLVDHGLHPQPIQPNMQITHSGGEMGHSITLPASEAEEAARAIAEAGFGKWLL